MKLVSHKPGGGGEFVLISPRIIYCTFPVNSRDLILRKTFEIDFIIYIEKRLPNPTTTEMTSREKTQLMVRTEQQAPNDISLTSCVINRRVVYLVFDLPFLKCIRYNTRLSL